MATTNDPDQTGARKVASEPVLMELSWARQAGSSVWAEATSVGIKHSPDSGVSVLAILDSELVSRR